MAIIKFIPQGESYAKHKITPNQLKFLEYLVSRVEPTFKVNRMPKIVKRDVVFLSDLRFGEASWLISVLKKELGIN